MTETRSRADPGAGFAPDRIALIGLGLIGGSIARALRTAAQPRSITAWSPSGRGPGLALAEGVIDSVAGSVGEAVADATLVILAGPPLATLALLEDQADVLRAVAVRGGTITDVASTKAAIVEAADRAALPFVGGHPMAGRETSGFGAADAALFVGRPWVVVPGAAARAVDLERVEGLARAVGARPVALGATDHDAAVAAVSHLPLVAATALVEAVAGAADWPTARRLAASGWSDMTRLALGDAEMGAGILATNRFAVVAQLRAYRAALDAWIGDLETDSQDREGAAALRSRLQAARARLDEGRG
jgi:prephenate dehydrogenase